MEPATPGFTSAPQSSNKKWRRPAVIILAALALIMLTLLGYLSYKWTQRPTQTARPNIIFILTDDLSLNLMQFMPKTKSLIGDQGATFSNYFDNISLCCPARTSIMRGQYAHNTGVEDNSGPKGGFSTFYKLGLQNSNVATWLKDSGYTNSMMGKYLNGYPGAKKNSRSPNVVDYTYVPPGWDDWFVPVKGSPYTEFNYTMNKNRQLVSYGNKPADYMVDVISNRAAQFIKDNRSNPYFMYLATYAPHAPYTPAPRYANTQSTLTYPKNASYNETDVSDKPSFIAAQTPITAAQQANINDVYQKRAEAVRAVDDLVKNLYDTLKSTGQLDGTYIVFTSDNGYHMGEHRLNPGKNTPYDTDIHLPLYVRGPGIKAGTKSDALVGNIDLAPTFGSMAGAKVPSYVDGKSLLPELTGQKQAQNRNYYLLERQPSTFTGEPEATTPDEPQDKQLPGKKNTVAEAFQGVRSKNGYTYVEYLNGEKEFYNLNTDPYELRNLIGKNAQPLNQADQSQLTLMKAALSKLRSCQAAGCMTQ